MNFIHGGSENAVYRFSSCKKLDGIATIWQHNSLKICFNNFDRDAEKFLRSIPMYLQIASTYIYNDYTKLKSTLTFLSHIQTMLSLILPKEQYYKMML